MDHLCNVLQSLEEKGSLGCPGSKQCTSLPIPRCSYQQLELQFFVRQILGEWGSESCSKGPWAVREVRLYHSVEGAVEAVHHPAELGIPKGEARFSDSQMVCYLLLDVGFQGSPPGLKHVHPS